MADSVQNEKFSETTLVADAALQDTKPNFDDNNIIVTPELSYYNEEENSLCDVKTENMSTITSQCDTDNDLLNDTTVDVVHSVLEKSSNSDENHYEDYKMGDIVWAKIGKYPYWPSVVCNEPTSDVYLRKLSKYFSCTKCICNFHIFMSILIAKII